eukprot:719294_1
MSSKMLSILFVFLLLLTLSLSADPVVYEQAFEHANQTTSFTESTELTNAGYKSHYDSLSFITSDTVLCYGAYSCSKASLISALRLDCDGDSSCSKVSNIQKLHSFPLFDWTVTEIRRVPKYPTFK